MTVEDYKNIEKVCSSSEKVGIYGYYDQGALTVQKEPTER